MATTATLVHTHAARQAGSGPRSFTPPGDRSLRLSHLDPRPLWRNDADGASPWHSPTFWLAYALVAPMLGLRNLFQR